MSAQFSVNFHRWQTMYATSDHCQAQMTKWYLISNILIYFLQYSSAWYPFPTNVAPAATGRYRVRILQYLVVLRDIRGSQVMKMLCLYLKYCDRQSRYVIRLLRIPLFDKVCQIFNIFFTMLVSGADRQQRTKYVPMRPMSITNSSTLTRTLILLEISFWHFQLADYPL